MVLLLHLCFPTFLLFASFPLITLSTLHISLRLEILLLCGLEKEGVGQCDLPEQFLEGLLLVLERRWEFESFMLPSCLHLHCLRLKEPGTMFHVAFLLASECD